MRPIRFRVPPEHAGGRLDMVIPACCSDLSRRATRRLIASGNVFVDGHRLRVASRALRAGADVRVEPPPPPRPDVPEPDVLWMDASVLIANKPSGMPTEPTRRGAAGTLSDALLKKFVKAPAGGGDRFLAAVNRLDVETSGAVAFAREREAAALLGQAFAEGAVERRYIALVHGEVENPWQVIDLPIGPGERPGLMAIRDDGKPSQTLVSVLATGRRATLLLVTPRTGRTHQIRVHLAAIGHPLFGERRYADAPRQEPFGLHAIGLSVPHPDGRQTVRAHAPIPAPLAAAAAKVGIGAEVLEVAAKRYAGEGA